MDVATSPTTLHLALDIRATDAHFPGIARATLGLVRGLHALSAPFEIDLITNPGRPPSSALALIADDPRFRIHQIAPGPFAWSQQWRVPALARRLAPQLWHAPYYVRPLMGLPPVVVSVYDLIGQRVPGAMSLRSRMLFTVLVRLSTRTARAVVTSSAAAAHDLQTLHRIPAQRLHVVPLAADPHFVPPSPAAVAAVRGRYGLPPRYVLYVGSNKAHKQPDLAIRAFVSAVQRDPTLGDVDFVLAGRWDARLPAARHAAAALPHRVHHRPDFSDTDLPALMGGAEVFVFPSLYEGFGLPPLEAMACGTPVIVADRTSLPEVVGDAGLRVPPTEAAVADALAALLHDPARRAQLRTLGLARAATFSWERTAQAMLAVYRQVSG